MKTEYLGYTITYTEEDDEWRVNMDGARKKSKSLKSLKKQIDNFLNPKVKFEKVPCLFYDRWGSFFGGFITSVAENNYGANEVWTINSKKQRSKKLARECYLDTEDNLLKAEQFKGLKDNIKKLQEQANGVVDSMETYKIKTDE